MMHRFMFHASILIACISMGGATAAAGTPPKKQTPGLAVPGDKSQAGRAIRDQTGSRGALPARTWFQVLAGLEVTRKQQDEITPVIRQYLTSLDQWKKVGVVQMRELGKKARESSDDAERESLMKQARELRRSMPRYDKVKERVWNMLTPFQRARLFELTQEYKSSVKQGILRTTEVEQEGSRPKSNDSRIDPGQKQKQDPVAWRFDDDQEPERHGPSKEPSDPAKKPASGDEASPGS